MILKMEPKILEARYKDGSTFKASNNFVHCWAQPRDELGTTQVHSGSAEDSK